MFINPMWDNEAERVGKQRCTPLGYAIHVISDLIGFVGLLTLSGVIGFLVLRAIDGTFETSQYLLLFIPFALGITGSMLFWVSWKLARRKGFKYDYDTQTASWLESGRYCSYNDTSMESD